jgi:hypothetical protein
MQLKHGERFRPYAYLSNLYNPLTICECLDERVMNLVERCNERRVSAVHQTYPHEQASLTRTIRQKNKILILADDRPAFCFAKLPNIDVMDGREIQVNYVGAIVPSLPQIDRELKGKLVINDELHAVFKTI